MNKKFQKSKRLKRKLRAHRLKGKVYGTAQRPRLSVYRSLKGIQAQLINDTKGETVLAVGQKQIKDKGTKTEIAKKMGQLLAQKAAKKKIKKVVFDRGGFQYHGRVKALAEGAREKGLIF